MYWQVSVSSGAACFSSPNNHSTDFALFQPLRSQHKSSRLDFGLHSCPTTILYYKLCLPFHPPHPPNVNISYTTLHVQVVKFLCFIWQDLLEQSLVLGQLSNTVNWSTFCVSFVPVLTIFN